jgi:hypothetical protein
MNTEDLLDVVRQKIGQAVQEINGEAPSYGDSFILRSVKTANFHLITLGVVTGVIVDTVNDILLPDSFSIPIGMLLASAASASLIRDDLLSRLRRGELGLAFSTGATTISTNQAAISLQAQADNLDRWHELLFTAYLSGDPNGVIQRADSVGFDIFAVDPNFGRVGS